MQATPHPAAARTLVALLATLTLVSCGPAAPTAKSPPPVAAEPTVQRHVAALTDLLTGVRLTWLVLAKPEQLAALRWLRPSIRRVLRDERLDLLARATGIDLRAVPELALASYRPRDGEAGDGPVAFLVRHRADPIALERQFRARLTSAAVREVAGPGLVTVWGNIGSSPHGMVVVGRNVVGYQYGGTRRSGPAHIAALYADGRLRAVPPALHGAALGRQLVAAPLAGYLPGPFEGAMARGARGLLGAADGVAIIVSPTDTHALRVTITLVGAFDARSEEALGYLALAWRDLATSDLGHLLGLDRPTAPPTTALTPEGLRLATSLDADALLRGLADATSANVADMMRRP